MLTRYRLPLAVLAGMLAGWLFTASAQPTAAEQDTRTQSRILDELETIAAELETTNRLIGGMYPNMYSDGVRDLLEDIRDNTR